LKRTKTQSWADEHEQFSRNANHIKLGNKWKFGFYQVIRDKNPPITKIKDNNLTEFLIPEEHLSLKLFFDNFRNYAISAAFISLGGLVWSRSTIIIPTNLPEWVSTYGAPAIWLMACLLLLFNLMQTFVLLSELSYSIRAINISQYVFYKRENIIQYILSFTHILLDWALDAFVRLCVLVFSIAIIIISLGFVYYTIVLSPGIR
jgi:hypothetical protein